MNIQWNAEEYEKNFSFVHHYGSDLLDMITAPRGSLAVDLGCGNGALTQKIHDREYRTVGIDGSAEMLKLARELHPDLEFVQADARNFRLEEPADVIFSNAVFHWIDEKDQPALIQSIGHNLKEGGQLVCEFGGSGCAETVHAALEKAFQKRNLKYPRVFFFPTIGKYAPLLEQAGLIVKEAMLFDRPTPQNGPNGVENWIRMFCKKPFEGMETALADEIIADAVNTCRDKLLRNDVWIVDYVRIRIKAVKV